MRGGSKFKDKPLWLVIVASWAVAFFEYLFQVPANRIGSPRFTLAQDKCDQQLAGYCCKTPDLLNPVALLK
jgi:uncharacterized protein